MSLSVSSPWKLPFGTSCSSSSCLRLYLVPSLPIVRGVFFLLPIVSPTSFETLYESLVDCKMKLHLSLSFDFLRYVPNCIFLLRPGLLLLYTLKLEISRLKINPLFHFSPTRFQSRSFIGLPLKPILLIRSPHRVSILTLPLIGGYLSVNSPTTSFNSPPFFFE